MFQKSSRTGTWIPWLLLVSFALLLVPEKVLSLQHPGFVRSSKIKSALSMVGGSDTLTASDQTSKRNADGHKSSLISSYLVDVFREQSGDHVWSLTPIDDVVPASNELSSGARSWQALHQKTNVGSATPTLTLTSRRNGNTIEVEVSSSLSEEKSDLLFVLIRVLAQFTAQSTTDKSSQLWNIVCLSGTAKEEVASNVSFSIENVRSKLFHVDDSAEIVDMVDQEGNVLGMVPRGLVHKLNILHRGIGLTVSKDKDFSELYCHRRTDTKRIFPSLYDMLVGGVSISGEDPKVTAAREVAEELGLSQALDEDGQPNHSALSDPLFKCVVCTSYNRCVVTVFQYTIQNPSTATISWQEEEVAWGDFVPIDIIEAAADLSIQRLVSKGEWPGMLPATQSKWKGSKPPNIEYENEDWMNWDFVPDGLLVWEAWLKWRQTQ